MGRRVSIINDPDFRWFAFIIGLLLISVFYVNYQSGGIVNGIVAVLNAGYNLGYGFIFAIYLVVLMAWTFNKWEILGAIVIPIAIWFLSFVYHKRI